MQITKELGLCSVTVATMLSCAVLLDSQTAYAASLSGSFTEAQLLNQNLTVEGTQDWAVWGYANNGESTSLSPDVRKTGGAGISNLTSINNGNPLRGLGQFGDYGQSTFDWLDGTPQLTATGAFTGLQHDGGGSGFSTIGEGFEFTVAADTTEKILRLYTTTNFGQSQLIATLLDGSGLSYTHTFDATSLSGNQPGVYDIRYTADTASQLSIRLVLAQDFTNDNSGNVAIQAASLAGTPAPIPTPALLPGLIGLCLSALRKSRQKSELTEA